MTGKHAKPADEILVIGVSEDNGARYAMAHFPDMEVCVIWPTNTMPMHGHRFEQVYFTPAMLGASDPIDYAGLEQDLAELEAIDPVAAAARQRLDKAMSEHAYALGGAFTPEQVEVITGAEPAAVLELRPRLLSCIEQWPGCIEGEYNPSCCRFPKSCSCTVYGDDIPPEMLEADQ